MPVDFKGKTPDITPVQLTAVIGAAITVAAAFGLHISHAQRDALLNLAQVVFPVLIAADALIRHGRSRQLAPAQVAEPAPEPDVFAVTPAAVPQDGNDADLAAFHEAGANGGGPLAVVAGG